MKTWFNAKVDDEGKVATIRIFDQIGDSWFGESTTAKGFTDAVDAFGVIDQLNVHLNSPGGNVYDGLAIFNYLKRHQAFVTVYVDGIAASIASIIAMAGDEIVMPANSTMFIHNPWTFAGGDASSLRKTAEELDTLRESLLGIYMDRVNLDRDDVAQMMDEETLLTAEEAVAWGFADELEEANKIAADLVVNEALSEARMAAENEIALASIKAEHKRMATEMEALQAANNMLNDALEEALEGTQPDPMTAERVVEVVAEADLPEWLATHCISAKLPETHVQALMTDYAGIRDACAAAGIQNPDELCRPYYGDNIALIAALLVEAGAAADEGITNRVPLDEATTGNSEVALDYDTVYANRKPQS